MSSLAPGIRLGPYEVISPLGAGGMGEVWRARDSGVDRIVAIKSSQQQFSGRFEREARAIAALNHPNICSLFDIGPDYLVMECVDGVPISPVQNTRKLLDLAVRLTSTTGEDFIPRYSPDGKSIAFGWSLFGEFGIWRVAVGNSVGTALTTSLDATLAAGGWAADGKSLLYFSTTQGGWQVYRVVTDTGHITRVTNDKADDFFPNYSRDGNWIYFSSTRSGEVGLYKMAASGGPATLTVPRAVTNAQESPDGRWLYFADWLSGNSLWRMPAAGGEITRVAERISDPVGYAATNQGVYYLGAARASPRVAFHQPAITRGQIGIPTRHSDKPQPDDFSRRTVSLLSGSRT